MSGNGSDGSMFQPAERLVLDGYRHWIVGVSDNSRFHMEQIERLYAEHLTKRDQGPAIRALFEFVGTLGMCAKCPLKMYRAGSENLCRDEALILALVAGLQNGDDAAVELSLSELSCQSRCDEVAFAAGVFALLLKGTGHRLLPVPVDVIRDILARSSNTIASNQQTGSPKGRARPTFH